MRDPRTEAWLQDEGVPFDYVAELALALIDEARSLGNQARYQAIDESLVKDYETLMGAGTKFPPIVVYVSGNKYVIIDGNHRYRANKNKARVAIDAYIVRVSDQFIIERLTRSANQTNGKRATAEEALQSALHLIETYGKPVTEVADAFGIPPSRLGNLARTRATRDRLRAMQEPKAADRLLDSHANTMASIDNDRVLKEAALAVTEGGSTLTQIADLVRDIGAARTEMDQLIVVKKFTESSDYVQRKAETRNGRSHSSASPPRQRITAGLGALISACKKYRTREQLGLTDDAELTRVRAQFEEAVALTRQLLYGEATGTDTSHQGVNGRREAAISR